MRSLDDTVRCFPFLVSTTTSRCRRTGSSINKTVRIKTQALGALFISSRCCFFFFSLSPMTFSCSLLICSQFFSLTTALHFLGGSFTYRHVRQTSPSDKLSSIAVEVRFHISNHYFICTQQQVNEHLVVYLIGESITYDAKTKAYLWHDVGPVRKNRDYYRIQCHSDPSNKACNALNEEMWAYCESANENSGYSILRRQFMLRVDLSKPIQLHYVGTLK